MSPQDEAEWDEIGNRLERSIRTMSNEKRETTALAVMAPQDVREVAAAVAKTRLFKGFENEDHAFVLMMLCQAEGMHPITAVRRYDVIQGRPAKKAEAMLADFLQRGGTVKWHDLTNEKVSATFTAPGNEATISWSIEDAKRAGLAGKDNWRNFPRAMLRSRVVSEGIRTTMPGVVAGVYTPEEVADFDAPPPPTYIPPPETQAKLAAVSAASREASKGFADGSARSHREAPGHGPKAPPAPSAASSTSPSSTASGPAPSAPATTAPVSAAAALTASTAPPTVATATTSPASDLPKEATAPSATSPSSTPSGAQDVPCLFETPIGMVVKEGVLADPNRDQTWGRGVKPDGGDFVWSVSRNAQTKAVSWCGWESRRTDGQSKRMFQLFNQRGIKEEDSQNGVQNKPVEGWRSRLRKRYLKESTKDLSERECDHLIRFLERMNEQFGDLADRRQRMADSGLEQRQDGSWGDGGAA